MYTVKVYIRMTLVSQDFVDRHLKDGLFNTAYLFNYLIAHLDSNGDRCLFKVSDTPDIRNFKGYITDSLEAYENLLDIYKLLGILDTESLRAPPFRPLN